MQVEDRIIFEAVVGSKAFGLDDAHSDTDRKGLWVGPPVMNVKDVYVSTPDRKLIEIRHLGLQMLKGDLNVTELLHATKVLYVAPWFHFSSLERLRELSTNQVWGARAVSFMRSQLNPRATPKELVHAYRVGHTVLDRISTGKLTNDVNLTMIPGTVDVLKRIKRNGGSSEALDGLRQSIDLFAQTVERNIHRLPPIITSDIQTAICEQLSYGWFHNQKWLDSVPE